MTKEILQGKVGQLFDGVLHFEGVQLHDGGLQNAVIGLRCAQCIALLIALVLNWIHVILWEREHLKDRKLCKNCPFC